MSFFLRQLWKQKPSMYGPVSAVQRDIFLNAERCGIDPGSIALYLPMWGPGNQQDYGPGGLTGINSGVKYQENGLYYTTDNTITYPAHPAINNYGPGPFTVITQMNDIDITYDDYIFQKEYFSLRIISSSSRQFSFGIDLYGQDIGNTYSYQPEGSLDSLAFVYDGGSSSSGLKFYRNGVFQTPNDPTEVIGGTATQDDSAEIFVIGNLTKTFMTSFLYVKAELEYSQIALLSDHPYILLQRNPQRRYFVSATGLPTPVNLAGVPGFNSITWSWESGA